MVPRFLFGISTAQSGTERATMVAPSTDLGIWKMKRIVIGIICIMFASVCFAQNEAVNNETKSKTLAFMAKDGTLLQKEVHYLGNIKNVLDSISFEVMFIKDVLANLEIGCLRLEQANSNKYSSDTYTYVGTLDYDEIDACIQSLTYIKSIIKTLPEKYTEIEYKTNDNLKMGVYSSNKGWTFYIYIQSKKKNWYCRIDISEKIDEVINYLSQGKSIIESRNK